MVIHAGAIIGFWKPGSIVGYKVNWCVMLVSVVHPVKYLHETRNAIKLVEITGFRSVPYGSLPMDALVVLCDNKTKKCTSTVLQPLHNFKFRTGKLKERQERGIASYLEVAIKNLQEDPSPFTCLVRNSSSTHGI